MDADDFRSESRERWEQAATGWEERREAFQRDAQPVSVWLVEHLEPQPGYRLLEVAGGVGDTGLLAAELVRPGGTVLITDGAEAMVEAARRRAAELGADNVEVRQMEAEWLDLPTASVDGVMCRWGFMLLADPEAALRETRRVLRPGGRVTFAAWAPPEHNPWFTILQGTAAELGLAEPPDPSEPGPFSFAKPGRIEELLEGAGFDELLVAPLDFAFRLPSREAYFEHQRALSPRIQALLAGLSPADHTRVRDEIDRRLEPYLTGDGAVVLPARTWVAAALG